MDKPLKDWTLGKVMEACRVHIICQTCPFYRGEFANKMHCDTFGFVPELWELRANPRWTEQEVEDAKTLQRMFGNGFYQIRRGDEINGLFLAGRYGVTPMLDDIFPSLKPGETAELTEIAGED